MFESIRVVSRGVPTAVVVGVFNDKKLPAGAKGLDKDGVISGVLTRGECTGDCGKLAEGFRTGRGGKGAQRVIVAGLGKREGFQPGALRAVGGAVGRRLAQTKDERVEVELGATLAGVARLDMMQAGRCFGEGLGLIGWNYTRFKGTGQEHPKRGGLGVSFAHAAFGRGAEAGLALARCANFTRDLSETPPNVATPAFIAAQARAMARKAGLSCRVIDGAGLVRERLEGLINVGKGSVNKPCLIRLEYRPRGGAKGRKPLVLVGKTMTYDTGGLSLKVNNGMVGMKRDKDGGCAVLGAMQAIGTVIRPNRPVVALLAVAENSVSDVAYRPDDVLTYRNGVTVEVTNTDAEGRLVLADALIWACENENPAAIIDMATLTGGVVTALGSTFAGLFCEDDGLRARLERAMASSGERWWRLPMDQEYRDMMKSPIADILNSNPNRKAHPIQGAAFLSYFVEKGIPWAHIDIAGVHAVESDAGCFVKGPTGWGVRLLADLVDQ